MGCFNSNKYGPAYEYKSASKQRAAARRLVESVNNGTATPGRLYDRTPGARMALPDENGMLVLLTFDGDKKAWKVQDMDEIMANVPVRSKRQHGDNVQPRSALPIYLPVAGNPRYSRNMPEPRSPQQRAGYHHGDHAGHVRQQYPHLLENSPHGNSAQGSTIPSLPRELQGLSVSPPHRRGSENYRVFQRPASLPSSPQSSRYTQPSNHHSPRASSQSSRFSHHPSYRAPNPYLPSQPPRSNQNPPLNQSFQHPLSSPRQSSLPPQRRRTPTPPPPQSFKDPILPTPHPLGMINRRAHIPGQTAIRPSHFGSRLDDPAANWKHYDALDKMRDGNEGKAVGRSGSKGHGSVNSRR